MALGWSAADLGGLLYESLRTKLLTLPDSSLVYPAHGAGSLCGKALGKETFSTIGEQRRVNYALQPMTKAAFVELVTADQPDAPAYFTYDAVLNSKERPTLDDALSRELKPLTLDEVLALQASGAQVLDTREPGEFASAHLSGSVNIALGGQYATWAGTVLSHERPIVIVADPGAENESALRLGRIGFDHVAGYLEDGMASLRDRARSDRHDRAPERAGRRRAAEREGSARSPWTCARRSSAPRSASRGACTFRSVSSSSDGASCRPDGRCSCTARPAIARRSRRACSSGTASRRSARWPAA